MMAHKLIEMRQKSQDINWKYLAISLIIAFIIYLINYSILIFIKEKALLYWFDNIRTTSVDDVVLQTKNFVNSIFWIIPAILVCFITQTAATIFLTKKTPDKELTNGLALGLISIVFIYQLNYILSIACIIFSLSASYKIKNNRLRLLQNQ